MDWYPLWNSLRIALISCAAVFFLGIFAAYYIARLPRVVKGVLDVLLTLLGAAGCNFVMGIPGSDDIMLNYQTTSFHDALYVRRLLGLRPAPEFEAWLHRMQIFEGDGVAQLGAALPAGDLAVLAIARVHAEGPRAHVHLLRLGGAAGFGQRGVQRLFELRLHACGVRGFLGGGQRQHQQVLLHLHRARCGELQHVLRRRRRILSVSGHSARHQCASSYCFYSSLHGVPFLGLTLYRHVQHAPGPTLTASAQRWHECRVMSLRGVAKPVTVGQTPG